MKAQIRPNKDMMIEVEAETQKELFKEICSVHEVFGEKKCGLCGSDNITLAWRTATVMEGKKSVTYEYPEYRCHGRTKDNKLCKARLSLGSINDDSGKLFPNRKLINGKPPGKDEREKAEYGAHNGWYRFVPDTPTPTK